MNSNRGFTLVEVLLVIIALSLLVFTGTYVYQSNKKDDTSRQQTTGSGDPESTLSTDSKNEDKEQTDPTADWLQYSPPSGAYTVRLADGWKLTRYESSNSLGTFNNDNIKPQPGVKAVVEQLEGGKDGMSGFFLNYYAAGDDPFVGDGAVKQNTFKTSSDMVVVKYLEVEEREELEGMGQVNKGGKYYTYIVKSKDGKAVRVEYSIQPDHIDYSSTVEQVLKTLQIK